MSPAREPFLRLADVAEILNISGSQAYALVRRGDLASIKVGGRGQYRVDPAALDDYIERASEDAKRFIREHPFVDGETPQD